MVVEVKELPEERATSKYSSAEVKLGAPAGLEPYWATVRAPRPVAEAVVLSLVAVAVPVELLEEPLAELVAPAGAVGAVTTLAAMPTTGLTRGVLPVEPWKGALKAKMPPSEAASQ